MTAMKCLLFSMLVIATAGSATCALLGTECTTPNDCVHKIGYIRYYGFDSLSNFWKITGDSMNFYKDFVITIKNIKLRNQGENWLYIQNQYLSGDQNRILVFRQTVFVFMYINNANVISFDLEYTAGCEVHHGLNANISKSATTLNTGTNSFWNNFFHPIASSNPTCWVLIPREETPLGETNPEIQETYIAFDNVTINNETTIQVSNMLEGTTFLSMNGVLERSISKTKKSSLRFLYGQAVVSTMILIDMKCKHSRDCNDASFIATTNNFQQSDMDCIKENQCRLGLIDTNKYCPSQLPGALFFAFQDSNTAFDVIETGCPAFSVYISEKIYSSSLNGADEEESSGGVGIEGRAFNVEKECGIKNIYLMCYVRECNKAWSRVLCGKVCTYIKRGTNMCKYAHHYLK